MNHQTSGALSFEHQMHFNKIKNKRSIYKKLDNNIINSLTRASTAVHNPHHADVSTKLWSTIITADWASPFYVACCLTVTFIHTDKWHRMRRAANKWAIIRCATSHLAHMENGSYIQLGEDQYISSYCACVILKFVWDNSRMVYSCRHIFDFHLSLNSIIIFLCVLV